MTESTEATPVIALITNLLEAWNGALIARSQVVDGLLDVRSAVRDHPSALTRIDEALGAVPGKTLVARDWAVDVLLDVNHIVKAQEPVADAALLP